MCDFWQVFEKDKPFRFHRTDEKTKKVLVGEIAEKYLYKFENEIYPLAMDQSLITAVIGQPGAGKTQFLNYIEGTKIEKNRICIILDLKDKKINYEYLSEHIINNGYLKEYLNSYGFELDYKKPHRDQILELGNSIHRIRTEQRVENAGLCLLIDAVDEYIRKIKPKNKSKEESTKESIKELIETIKELLKDLPFTCVILAITKDVYRDFANVFPKTSNYDETTDESFLFITDEGENLILEKFSEEDTRKMVSEFLFIWAERNKIFPEYQNIVKKLD